MTSQILKSLVRNFFLGIGLDSFFTNMGKSFGAALQLEMYEEFDGDLRVGMKFPLVKGIWHFDLDSDMEPDPGFHDVEIRKLFVLEFGYYANKQMARFTYWNRESQAYVEAEHALINLVFYI